MNNSIMPTKKGVCFICGACCHTDVHHVFGGANRQTSDDWGLTVDLCRICHRRAHEHPEEFEKKYRLKGRAQAIAMDHYGWSVNRFREYFRKSYL